MKDTISLDMGGSVPAPLGTGSDKSPGLAVLAHSEKEVLVALTDGSTSKEIAGRLGMGVRAVQAHRERLMRKLRIRGVARLTQFAIVQGLVALD